MDCIRPHQPAAPKAEILGGDALRHRQVVEAAELVAVRDDRGQVGAHDVRPGARREAIV